MCHPVEPSGSLKYIVCFSVVILLKPGMRNAFNMLLVSLSTMDNFWIILAIGDYSITRWVKYALVGKATAFLRMTCFCFDANGRFVTT